MREFRNFVSNSPFHISPSPSVGLILRTLEQSAAGPQIVVLVIRLMHSLVTLLFVLHLLTRWHSG